MGALGVTGTYWEHWGGVIGSTGRYWEYWALLGALGRTGSTGDEELSGALGDTGSTGPYWERWPRLPGSPAPSAPRSLTSSLGAARAAPGPSPSVTSQSGALPPRHVPRRAPRSRRRRLGLGPGRAGGGEHRERWRAPVPYTPPAPPTPPIPPVPPAAPVVPVVPVSVPVAAFLRCPGGPGGGLGAGVGGVPAAPPAPAPGAGPAAPRPLRHRAQAGHPTRGGHVAEELQEDQLRQGEDSRRGAGRRAQAVAPEGDGASAARQHQIPAVAGGWHRARPAGPHQLLLHAAHEGAGAGAEGGAHRQADAGPAARGGQPGDAHGRPPVPAGPGAVPPLGQLRAHR